MIVWCVFVLLTQKIIIESSPVYQMIPLFFKYDSRLTESGTKSFKKEEKKRSVEHETSNKHRKPTLWLGCTFPLG